MISRALSFHKKVAVSQKFIGAEGDTRDFKLQFKIVTNIALKLYQTLQVQIAL